MTMAALTTTAGERGAPLARLCMALITTLMGFCVSVAGFVVDDASMIVTGMFAGAFGSTAVNGLEKVVDRRRRRGSEQL
jgi:NAD/NADP transhydrogenase beta subunit